MRDHQEEVTVVCTVNRGILMCVQDSCGYLRCIQTRYTPSSQRPPRLGMGLCQSEREGVHGTQGSLSAKMVALPSGSLQNQSKNDSKAKT